MAFQPLSVQDYNRIRGTGTLPVAPAPQVGRPGLLGRVFKGLIGGIGAVDRSVSAGVGHILSPITAPVVSGIERANPGRFNVQAPNANDIFTNRVSPQLKAKAQASYGSFNPGSAFGQVNQAATQVGKFGFSGALEQSGALKTATGVGGTVRNLAIDFALDPLNFLSAGVGSGAKIANLSGKGMTLTTKGTALLKTERLALLKQVAGDVAKLSPDELKALDRVAELKIADMTTKTPGLIDKGGIKFAGKTLIPGEVSTQPLGKAVQAGFDKIRLNKVLGPGARDKLLGDNLLARRTIQTFRDTQDAANARFADLLNPTLKGLSKSDLEAATMLRAGGLEATPKLKPVLDLAEKTLSAMGKDLKSRGLIVGMLDNYLPLIAKDPAQVINGITLNEFFSRLGNKFAFGNPRKIKDTLEAIGQAKAAGYDVKTNIGELLKAYVTAANKSVATQDLYKNLVRDFGVPKNVFAGGTEPTKNATFKFKGLAEAPTTPTLERVANTKAVSLTGDALVPVAGARGLEDTLLPKFIADQLAVMGKESHAVPGIVRGYDTVLNTFRKFFTALPAYHLRNYVTNAIQNIMDVGLLSGIKASFNKDLIALQAGKDLERVIEVGGQKFTVGGLRKIMQDNGVLQGVGFFETTGNIGTGLAATSRRVGRLVENRARLVNFMANLEKTGSIPTAAEHVKHFLFDYANLSPFEQNVMRRVFLFPTWTSRNFLLQLEQGLKKPGFFSKYGILQSDLSKNSNPSDQAILPDYLTQDINVPLGRDAQGNPRTLSLPQTPLGAAAQMVQPQNILGMLTPPIKVGLETLTGQNFFTGKTIEEGGKNAGSLAVLRYAPEDVQKLFGFQAVPKVDNNGQPTGQNSYTANPWAVYVINSIPTSGLSNATNTLTDTSKPLSERLLKFVSGARINTSYVSTLLNQQSKEYGQQLAKDFINRGYINQGNNGYYVSKNIQLPPDQKAQADQMVSLLNDKGSLTSQYLASIGASPASFQGLTSGSTKSKAITNKQMAALLAYQAGQPEIGARILFPNAFKLSHGAKITTKGGTVTRSTKRIKVKIPSTRLTKPKKVSFKAKTPKKFRFVSKVQKFRLGR